MTVNGCFSVLFGHHGVSRTVLEPLRRKNEFLPIFVLENRTQNIPQIAFKKNMLSLFSRNPKTVFEDTFSMNQAPILKEKPTKRESVQRNNDSFSNNGGCRNSSPLSNRIAVSGSWDDKSIKCPCCFARVARNAAKMAFILEKQGIWPPKVAQGRHLWGRFSSTESTAETRQKRVSKSANHLINFYLYIYIYKYYVTFYAFIHVSRRQL